MSAKPIIPGRAYAVRHNGTVLTVLANHPCTALAIAARAIFGGTLSCR